jgi:Chromosome segregation ATPases
MKVKIEHLHIENFGKYSALLGSGDLEFDLGRKTIISGRNKSGKTTIRRAVRYIFGCKDENGKEITGIRPHDENGIDIDGLTTIAEMTVSVDGAENTLKKTCFQKKNRQGEYTGEDNTQYFIDGVRKNTRKSYDEFVQTILPDPVCMSAQEFFKQDAAGRRKLLESTFFSHTIDEIIDQNPEFEELRGKLRANSVSDLKSACNEKINGKGRGANHVDGLNDKLTKLKHQIEFELSKKVDIDVAGLEAQKKAIDEKISKLEERQEDISKEFEEQQKASDGILELKFKLNDLQRKANEDLEKKRREIRVEIDNAEWQLKEIRHQIRLNKQDIEAAQKSIDTNTVLINATRESWKAANERVFDENSLICSYCGQEYPEERKDQIKSDFGKKREEELAFLTKRGNELKAAIDKDKEEIEQLKATLKENEDEEINLAESIKGLEKCLEEVPQSVDISDRPEVQEIQRKIAEKEDAMSKGSSAEEIKQQLKDELKDLQLQTYEVQKQLDKAEENNRIDKVVEELNAKQRNVSQEIANVERELDLLKQFDRKKAELLENDVNSNFEYIKVKMTELQVNGDLKDVCQITVDGESYDRNLNHGARILAEIDICRAFQKANNVCLPIIVDDCESLDDWRVPSIENQLIIIKRSDNKELKIEMEG